MRHWFERLFAHFRRQRELREEVEFHLQMRAELNRQEGLSEVDAADQARRQFGNRAGILEDMRAVHVNHHLDTTIQDLKYAVRGLARSPGFATTAILTLALGIGANTSIFSVVHTLVFQPLPYEGSERFVRISEYRIGAIGGVEQRWTAIPTYEFRAIAAQTRTLSDVAAYAAATMTLAGVDVPVRLAGARVSPSLFGLLGAKPIVGRVFEPEEGELPAGPVVVISQRLWQQSLSGDRDVLGGR
jgi:putative ABC transport system permease protein